MVMINRLINFLNDKYEAWQEKRFLKRHGVNTWADYHHRHDPDISWCADDVKDFYHGYLYVHCFENTKSQLYYWDVHLDGIYIAQEWAAKNLTDKYRMDFHRVRDKSLDNSGSWVRDELGGRDFIFAAFKNKKDYTMFVMKMS